MGLLAVVLGSPSSAERFDAATQLLDYGFSRYETAEFPQIEGRKETLAVKGGVSQQVTLAYEIPEKILLEKGGSQTLTAQTELPEQLEAPVKQGGKVGEVTLKTDSTVIGTYPVVAAGEVSKMDFSTAFSLLSRAIFTL